MQVGSALRQETFNFSDPVILVAKISEDFTIWYHAELTEIFSSQIFLNDIAASDAGPDIIRSHLLWNFVEC